MLPRPDEIEIFLPCLPFSLFFIRGCLQSIYRRRRQVEKVVVGVRRLGKSTYIQPELSACLPA